MTIVLFIKTAKRGRRHDRATTHKIKNTFYCANKHENILKKMGEAFVNYKNFKAGSDADDEYFFEIKDHVGKKIWSNYTIKENEIKSFIEEKINFLEEAKIAQRRKCVC